MAAVPISPFRPPRQDQRLCLRVSRRCLSDLQQLAAAADAPPATLARHLLEQSLAHHLADR